MLDNKNKTTRPERRHAPRRSHTPIARAGRPSAGVLTARELRTEVLAILG